MKKLVTFLLATLLLSNPAYAVVEGTRKNLVNELKSKGSVIVEFYATWCHWCQKLKPEIEALDKKYKGQIKFVAVDVDKIKEIQPPGLPALVLFKDGTAVSAFVGYNPDQLNKMVQKALEK